MNPTPPESVQLKFRRATNRHRKFAAQKSELTHWVEPSQPNQLTESDRVKAVDQTAEAVDRAAYQAAEALDRAVEAVDQLRLTLSRVDFDRWPKSQNFD